MFTKKQSKVICWLVFIVWVGFLVGCVAYKDATTGKTTYGMTAPAANALDTAAAAVEGGGSTLATIITAVNPAAGGIAWIVVGVLGSLAVAWKKWRTPLVEAVSWQQKAASAIGVAVDVIDTYVKSKKVDATTGATTYGANWLAARAALETAAKASGVPNIDKILAELPT